MYDVLVAVVLGIVEGLTEFLPVSSTGHMILVGELLRFTGERAETFEIVIQLGAILAVGWIYRARFVAMTHDAVRGRALFPQPGGRAFTVAHLAVACAPAFVLGAVLHGFIKRQLFSPRTVLVGLVLGAVFMVVSEVLRRDGGSETVDALTLGQALAAGCAQCLALWPGFSRSGSMIAGGLLAGMGRRTAAEFSFLVSVPVMVAATGFDLVRSIRLIDNAFLLMLAVGFVVAFVVAWLAVVAFLRIVQRVSLVPFAVYRIAVALVYWLVVLR